MNTNFYNELPTFNMPSELCPLLEKAGIVVSGISTFDPLTGGVASEVWLLESAGKQYCVKRALSKLKVQQEWQVSVKRSEFEVLWLQTVANLLSNKPTIVPKVLASDDLQHAFVMEYFPPKDFPIWKHELAKGNISTQAAIELAEALGEIHQYSACLPELAQCFDNQEVFYQIRIEPYFLATAKKHPKYTTRIEALAQVLAATNIALVHGDISPKNILIGKQGPIILDAECAVYGDPAFDIAFLLNHFLLKSFMVFEQGKEKVDLLCECFVKAFTSYLAKVDWEDKHIFEKRVMNYLGVFLLARVDGKSPVEYISSEADKDFIRKFSLELINTKSVSIITIAEQWRSAFIEYKNI